MKFPQLDFACILHYIYMQEGGMAILQVRDVPEELYQALSELAKQDNRSISQQTIVILKQALNYEENKVKKRKRLLEKIRAHKIINADAFPDPAELIREDRDR